MYETRATTVGTVDGDLGHLSLIVDTDSSVIVDADLGHLSLIPCALAPLPPPLPLPLARAPLVRLPFPCLHPDRLASGNLSQ